eukprot:gene11804-15796_t
MLLYFLFLVFQNHGVFPRRILPIPTYFANFNLHSSNFNNFFSHHALANVYQGNSELVNIVNYYPNRRVSILTEVKDEPGSFYEILRYFWKYDINLTHIESRPSPSIGDVNVDKLLETLRARCNNLLVLDEQNVPWFPRHISELDGVVSRTMDAGADLESDHPGFNDLDYRKRREELASISKQHQYGTEIPHINYSKKEIETCTSYTTGKRYFKLFDGKNRIPIETCNRSIIIKGFFECISISNILHESRPLYTPEPDICHELIGHVPMFADPDFADFSQEIGLASLGASDEVIKKLATCYWHSVEFGLVRGRDGTAKAYGAGLLSSFGEIQHACKTIHDSGTLELNKLENIQSLPIYLPWDPNVASETSYPITTYQPKYFIAE